MNTDYKLGSFRRQKENVQHYPQIIMDAILPTNLSFILLKGRWHNKYRQDWDLRDGKKKGEKESYSINF